MSRVDVNNSHIYGSTDMYFGDVYVLGNYEGISRIDIYCEIPNAPYGLSATDISYTSFTLNWIDTSDNEMGFNIDISEQEDFGVILDSYVAAENATSMNISGIEPSGSYYLRVNSFNLSGTSAWSETLNVSTLIVPATGDYVRSFSSNISISVYRRMLNDQYADFDCSAIIGGSTIEKSFYTQSSNAMNSILESPYKLYFEYKGSTIKSIREYDLFLDTSKTLYIPIGSGTNWQFLYSLIENRKVMCSYHLGPGTDTILYEMDFRYNTVVELTRLPVSEVVGAVNHYDRYALFLDTIYYAGDPISILTFDYKYDPNGYYGLGFLIYNHNTEVTTIIENEMIPGLECTSTQPRSSPIYHNGFYMHLDVASFTVGKYVPIHRLDLSSLTVDVFSTVEGFFECYVVGVDHPNNKVYFACNGVNTNDHRLMELNLTTDAISEIHQNTGTRYEIVEGNSGCVVYYSADATIRSASAFTTIFTCNPVPFNDSICRNLDDVGNRVWWISYTQSKLIGTRLSDGDIKEIAITAPLLGTGSMRLNIFRDFFIVQSSSSSSSKKYWIVK